jgi:hypothetical protein
MVLSSSCTLELHDIVFGGGCEDIVSLSVEVIHDLPVHAGAAEVY